MSLSLLSYYRMQPTLWECEMRWSDGSSSVVSTAVLNSEPPLHFAGEWVKPISPPSNDTLEEMAEDKMDYFYVQRTSVKRQI